VRAEKKNEELFYVSKKKLPLDENDMPQVPKKKARLSLEEKMANLACYRNLKPDPNSAPAHNVRTFVKPVENSSRQKMLSERMAKKYTARLQAKKRVRSKYEQPAEPDKKARKTNILTEANFNTDIWSKKKQAYSTFSVNNNF
jgi:hypothetical protein